MAAEAAAKEAGAEEAAAEAAAAAWPKHAVRCDGPHDACLHIALRANAASIRTT